MSEDQVGATPTDVTESQGEGREAELTEADSDVKTTTLAEVPTQVLQAELIRREQAALAQRYEQLNNQLKALEPKKEESNA